ncbi:hypothetical protein PR048_023102 [Dryococelus australis]|uniref:Uncharacterized protein n=1 Tax=Dryococelus australis TaxID=614101 RepID=A0ABQ9GT37_9NEOP|nr:hypothetical protein PR048_023102 [Dryococelus australis]
MHAVYYYASCKTNTAMGQITLFVRRSTYWFITVNLDKVRFLNTAKPNRLVITSLECPNDRSSSLRCSSSKTSPFRARNEFGTERANAGWERREIPEKTRRQTVSSGTIPTCHIPVTRPGTEPGANRSDTAALSLLPHTWQYRIRYLFHCKFAIGSEASRACLTNCNPIAKVGRVDLGAWAVDPSGRRYTSRPHTTRVTKVTAHDGLACPRRTPSTHQPSPYTSEPSADPPSTQCCQCEASYPTSCSEAPRRISGKKTRYCTQTNPAKEYSAPTGPYSTGHQFPEYWSGCPKPVEWPPSPDLSHLDFYLWGHLKAMHYLCSLHLYDCYDPANRRRQVDKSPTLWMSYLVEDSSLRVVMVSSKCARLQQSALVKGYYFSYKEPHYLDQLFIYGLCDAMTIYRNIYQKIFIVTRVFLLIFLVPHQNITPRRHLELVLIAYRTLRWTHNHTPHPSVALPSGESGVPRTYQSSNSLTRALAPCVSLPEDGNRLQFPKRRILSVCRTMPVFSGISHFPRPCIPALFHTFLASPTSALKTHYFKSHPILFNPLGYPVIIHFKISTLLLSLELPAIPQWANLVCTVQRHDENTARIAHRCDEALEVRVSIARIAPWLLDLGRGVPTGVRHTPLSFKENLEHVQARAAVLLLSVPFAATSCSNTILYSEIPHRSPKWFGDESKESIVAAYWVEGVVKEGQTRVVRSGIHLSKKKLKSRIAVVQSDMSSLACRMSAVSHSFLPSSGKRVSDALTLHCLLYVPSHLAARRIFSHLKITIEEMVEATRYSFTQHGQDDKEVLSLHTSPDITMLRVLSVGITGKPLVRHKATLNGAVVAQRLERSSPTNADRDRSWTFALGNRARRCCWSAGFLVDLPFSPPFHASAVTYSHHFALIAEVYQLNSVNFGMFSKIPEETAELRHQVLTQKEKLDILVRHADTERDYLLTMIGPSWWWWWRHLGVILEAFWSQRLIPAFDVSTPECDWSEAITCDGYITSNNYFHQCNTIVSYWYGAIDFFSCDTYINTSSTIIYRCYSTNDFFSCNIYEIFNGAIRVSG